MKTLLSILFLCNSLLNYGQYRGNSWQEFFFGRLPSARAEAMGKAYASMDGDLSTLHFNPAGIATINKIELNASYTPPPYYHTEGFYTFYAIGYRPSRYLQLALSQFRFDFGKTPVLNANTTPYDQSYTLTLASQPIKDLLVGLNTNYFIWQPGIDKAVSTFYFDLGMIKKVYFPEDENDQSLNIGASISNLNYSHVSAPFYGVTTRYNLPVITRYGANYQFSIGKRLNFDSARMFKFLLQSEYQLLLNSKYRKTIELGSEITIFDLLALRAGYFNEKVYNYNLPDYNKSKVNVFTYGFGLHIPLSGLTKIPVNINFDYTSLPQVNYTFNFPDPVNYNTFTLRLTIWPRK